MAFNPEQARNMLGEWTEENRAATPSPASIAPTEAYVDSDGWQCDEDGNMAVTLTDGDGKPCGRLRVPSDDLYDMCAASCENSMWPYRPRRFESMSVSWEPDPQNPDASILTSNGVSYSVDEASMAELAEPALQLYQDEWEDNNPELAEARAALRDEYEYGFDMNVTAPHYGPDGMLNPDYVRQMEAYEAQYDMKWRDMCAQYELDGTVKDPNGKPSATLEEWYGGQATLIPFPDGYSAAQFPDGNVSLAAPGLDANWKNPTGYALDLQVSDSGEPGWENHRQMRESLEQWHAMQKAQGREYAPQVVDGMERSLNRFADYDTGCWKHTVIPMNLATLGEGCLDGMASEYDERCRA